jgi:hypothetical protein
MPVWKGMPVWKMTRKSPANTAKLANVGTIQVYFSRGTMRLYAAGPSINRPRVTPPSTAM